MIRFNLRLTACLAALTFAAGTAGAACRVKKLADLPVTIEGTRAMVSAKINAQDTSFIVDSGAAYSLMPPAVAKAQDLRLVPAADDFRLGGIGGQTRAWVTTVKDFTIAGIPLHNVSFIVGGSETGGSGLIGQNVLGIADAEYDLPHGMIRLMESEGCEKMSLAYWVKSGEAFSTLDIEPRERAIHTIGTVYINGTAIRAIFDTGASGSVISLRAAARAGVKPGDSGVTPKGSSMGIGRKVVQTWTAPFASFKIGDEEIRNVRIAIGDISLGDADMLLGFDFFISHRIYVDRRRHRVFLSYTGGSVFDTKTRQPAAPLQDESAPTNAEGFSRRGAVLASQHELDRAIADFTKAIELAPKEPRYLLQRADVYTEKKQYALAEADLDKVLALNPTTLPALLDRAELRIRKHDRAGAIADVDAAAKAAPGPANEHLRIGQLYASQDAYDRAISQYDLWIAAHREDTRLAQGLSARCRARALANTELALAAADCEAALKLRPAFAPALDSRGLLRLRQHDYDRALADYEAALKLAPKQAWSLYGRGIARHHKGQAAEGDADIKAALAITPEIAERARKAGIE
jgi:tetratricopeptide (TPR) repeat protein